MPGMRYLVGRWFQFQIGLIFHELSDTLWFSVSLLFVLIKLWCLRFFENNWIIVSHSFLALTNLKAITSFQAMWYVVFNSHPLNIHLNMLFVPLVLGRQEFKWTIKDFGEVYKIEDSIISSNFTVYRSDSPKAEHFYLQVNSRQVHIFISTLKPVHTNTNIV
jgi:hypothetical protein